MSNPETDRIRPFLLRGVEGPLLAVYYPPLNARHPCGDVLVAPAFAEEMNRCRAMVSAQARMLAAVGIGTLVLDPYGTGDSAGEFAEASWDMWKQDLQCGINWLRREGNGCRTVWGIRLGAIMAYQLAENDPTIDHLLLWQPVLEGRTYLTQFLRIRIAAEIEQNDRTKSTDELRRTAAAGQPVEVSGYRLNPLMIRSLDGVRLRGAPKLPHLRLSWCEVLADAHSSVPRVSQKMIDDLRSGGVAVTLECAVGPSFWQLHERTIVPALLHVTSSLLAAPRPAPNAAMVAQGGGGFSQGRASTLMEVGGNPGRETPVVFNCAGEELVGILHSGKHEPHRGVVIVVAGGPQYRAGAHRQFVSLARKLSAFGYPVLRFDLRGMGDSSGEYLGFEHSEPDIRAAIDALMERHPTLEEIVLFGECESASGILFFAYRDSRVKGIVLVNPWVRTSEGRAGVIVKHYYTRRLFSAEFWRKVVSGRFAMLPALRDIVANGRAYLSGRKQRRWSGGLDAELSSMPLPVRTAAGLRRFRGRVMILMSGHDYIAQEFDEVVKSSEAWRGLLEQARVQRRELRGADHTFSKEKWKQQASDWICEWVCSW